MTPELARILVALDFADRHGVEAALEQLRAGGVNRELVATIEIHGCATFTRYGLSVARFRETGPLPLGNDKDFGAGHPRDDAETRYLEQIRELWDGARYAFAVQEIERAGRTVKDCEIAHTYPLGDNIEYTVVFSPEDLWSLTIHEALRYETDLYYLDGFLTVDDARRHAPSIKDGWVR